MTPVSRAQFQAQFPQHWCVRVLRDKLSLRGALSALQASFVLDDFLLQTQDLTSAAISGIEISCKLEKCGPQERPCIPGLFYLPRRPLLPRAAKVLGPIPFSSRRKSGDTFVGAAFKPAPYC